MGQQRAVLGRIDRRRTEQKLERLLHTSRILASITIFEVLLMYRIKARVSVSLSKL